MNEAGFGDRYLQEQTLAGLKLIKEIGGETDPPHPWYCQIVKEGTGYEFELSMNDDWLKYTRPILEAFSRPSFRESL
jgi:hypothetical protein